MRHRIFTIITALSCATGSAQDTLNHGGTRIIETTIDAKTYPCFFLSDGRLRQARYVIDSESVYSKYKENFRKHCDFPVIDFNKHTLLGIYAGGNNYCNVAYRTHVEDDQANARYVFTLTVIQNGFCKRAVRWRWHWVVVPRPPESYRVEFEVNRIREKVRTSKSETQESASDIDQTHVSGSINGSDCSDLTPGKSGIHGKTVSGPTRPVNISGDTTDAYVPCQGAGIVRRAKDNKEVARFTSDPDGKFRVSLPPGKYIIEPLLLDKKPWPRPDSPFAVTIVANQSVEIRIKYDTGIR